MSDLLKGFTNVDELNRLFEEEEGSTKILDADQLRQSLNSRVRGQEHVVDDLSQLISRQFAKTSRKRPVANLLFVGPTGTGKTELCKALAEALFDNEENRLQYDCGQFKDQSGISRLIGTAQGYAGGSGELTKAMMAKTQRIVIFDEIEKAHGSLCDLFLSMMGDGRVQDQKSGKVADFTEAIIVLTSNAEQDKLTQMQEETSDMSELNNALRVHLQESGTFRPEIIGRIDRIYVFKQLAGIVRAEIVLLKMRKIANEYGLEMVHVAPELIYEAVKEGDKLKEFGARQREQVVEDMLADGLLAAKRAGAKRVSIVIDDDGDLLIQPA
ncbi:MAG: AAA family ATPase [Pirellulales bacterium]